MNTQFDNLIKVASVRIGAARTEGRAPSHDGEYLTVIKLDDRWLATSNAGVVAGDESDWFDGDASSPSLAELAEAAGNAAEAWDFASSPDKYGFEARQVVRGWLDAPVSLNA